MTTIVNNVDLGNAANPITGWETCAAAAGNVVVYTGNWFAAYSTDYGNTFSSIDPYAMCRAAGEQFSCDQVVIYVPEIDSFAWILQTAAGNYVLAVATPAEIARSAGNSWTWWLIGGSQFTGSGQVDYPELASSPTYLYLTFNLSDGQGAVAVRFSLRELRDRAYLHFEYFCAPANYWLRPVQHTGDVGYFVCLNDTSSLRLFEWRTGVQQYVYNTYPIQTIPTEDFTVKGPEGDDWLGPTSKVDWHIYGATQSGNQIWAAWNGARRIAGKQSNSFNYPYIGIAVLDLGRRVVDQKYFWNQNCGFAWPALATNSDGHVGMSFCWGSTNLYPQHGVAVLTGPNPTYLATTSGRSWGAGGHYVSVRRSYPNQQLFSAAGYNYPKHTDPSDSPGHPHYVVFGP
jgi:hypothetical protein